jgi:hypothetical protein
MVTVDYIFDEFQITEEEYAELDKEFGNLCYKAAWELKKKNFRNNYTDEIEDIVQDLRWSMSRACIYTKRQRYIEASMKAVATHCDIAIERDEEDELIVKANNPKYTFVALVLEELLDLWENRTRHGASKQKFGAYQEGILDTLLRLYVPEEGRPNKRSKLEIDKRFSIYCKAIIWNCSKNLGKKITRERSIRSGMVSLSEHSYLVGDSYASVGSMAGAGL